MASPDAFVAWCTTIASGDAFVVGKLPTTIASPDAFVVQALVVVSGHAYI